MLLGNRGNPRRSAGHKAVPIKTGLSKAVNELGRRKQLV